VTAAAVMEGKGVNCRWTCRLASELSVGSGCPARSRVRFALAFGLLLMPLCDVVCQGAQSTSEDSSSSDSSDSSLHGEGHLGEEQQQHEEQDEEQPDEEQFAAE